MIGSSITYFPGDGSDASRKIRFRSEWRLDATGQCRYRARLRTTQSACCYDSLMRADLHYLSLLDVSERIRRRDLSSVEIVSALLARIAAFEPMLNGFLHVMGDTALADAMRADAELGRGQWRGPMHGVPIGIKDLIDVAGVPTTSGTEIMKDRVPAADATIVGRLKRAGAIVIGKTHMTEAATLDHHPMYQRPGNPWKSGFWTGRLSESDRLPHRASGFGSVSRGPAPQRDRRRRRGAR